MNGLNSSIAMRDGMPALVQAQLRPDHDHRAAGVVDALAEQVLAEAAGLALQHVGERLERALGRARDHAAAPAVVEQRVDRLLEHPLLVADDHLGRVQLLEPLQAVVAVDHAPVEVVQVAGREAAAVERHERAQIRRDHRDHLEDHVLGLVARLAERVEHLEPLADLLALRLARGLAHLVAQRLALVLDVERREHLADRLGADPDREALAAVLLARLRELLVVEQLAAAQVRLDRVDDDVRLEVEHLLEVAQRDLEDVPDPRRQRLQEPDVRDRRGERDVAHALAAHLASGSPRRRTSRTRRRGASCACTCRSCTRSP